MCSSDLHRYRVLCAVHLPYLGRRLLPVHQILPTEISDLISGIIIYLCAFSMLFRGKIQSLLFRNAEKTNVNAEPAPAAEKTKKEGK